MEHGQETQFLRFMDPRTRMRLRFRANDPFNPSIAQNIHNQRVTPGPQTMEDVLLPARRNVQPQSGYGRPVPILRTSDVAAQPTQTQLGTPLSFPHHSTQTASATGRARPSRATSSTQPHAKKLSVIRESAPKPLKSALRRSSLMYPPDHSHSRFSGRGPEARRESEDLRMASPVAVVPSGASEIVTGARPLPSLPTPPIVSYFPHSESSIDSQHTPSPYSIPSAHSHSSELHGPVPLPQSHAASLASDAKENTEHGASDRPHRHRRMKIVNDYLSTWQTDETSAKLRDYVETFVMDTLPRQVYLHFLLRLPSLYFTRVTRIFEEADLTLGEIKEMTLRTSAEDSRDFQPFMWDYGYYNSEAANAFPAYHRLKTAWEYFIDNLMREWKTLNIVSVLLLSAIMTMFQIQGAADDPITRYTAFWSLICALLSILYGCLFTIRFASMRKASKAAEWALVGRSQTLAALIIAELTCHFHMVECLGHVSDACGANLPPDHVFPVSPTIELAFRIFICIVLGTGVIYGIFIFNTFRRYGTRMDDKWRDRVENFVMEMRSGSPCPSSPSLFDHIEDVPMQSFPSSSESDQTPFIAAALGSRDLNRESEAIRIVPPTPVPPLPYFPTFHPRSRSRSRSHSPPRSPSPPQTSVSDDSDWGRSIAHSPPNSLRIPSGPRVSPTRGKSTFSLPVDQRDIKENRGRRRRRSHRRHRGRLPTLDNDGENTQSSDVSNGSVGDTRPPDETENIPQVPDEELKRGTSRSGSRSSILSNSSSKDWDVAMMRRSDVR